MNLCCVRELICKCEKECENIRVVIRARPLLEKEALWETTFHNLINPRLLPPHEVTNVDYKNDLSRKLIF